MDDMDSRVRIWREDLWLHVIDTLKKVEGDPSVHPSNKWKEVLKRLHPNVVSGMAKGEASAIQGRFSTLCCEVRGAAKRPRFIAAFISKKLWEKTEEFLAWRSRPRSPRMSKRKRKGGDKTDATASKRRKLPTIIGSISHSMDVSRIVRNNSVHEVSVSVVQLSSYSSPDSSFHGAGHGDDVQDTTTLCRTRGKTVYSGVNVEDHELVPRRTAKMFYSHVLPERSFSTTELQQKNKVRNEATENGEQVTSVHLNVEDSSDSSLSWKSCNSREFRLESIKMQAMEQFEEGLDSLGKWFDQQLIPTAKLKSRRDMISSPVVRDRCLSKSCDSTLTSSKDLLDDCTSLQAGLEFRIRTTLWKIRSEMIEAVKKLSCALKKDVWGTLMK